MNGRFGGATTAAMLCAALAFLSACGSSATVTVTASQSATTSPSASAAASATPPANALQIKEMGIQMLVPAGLTRVTYQDDSPFESTGTDSNGRTYHAKSVIISTPEFDAAFAADPGHCAGGGAATEFNLVVLDDDPANIPGPGFNRSVKLSDGRFLADATPDGGPCSPTTGAVFDRQAPILEAMFAAATVLS